MIDAMSEMLESTMTSLPANDLITAGIRDLDDGRESIEDGLYKYPAIDPKSFRTALQEFLKEISQH
ncbi:MAG TPA: hypothetical protein VFS76_12650 [Pyrinomonadaceae bacterium]|nr:hypothetical protein [Pyrinomonadaceae bacterium]